MIALQPDLAARNALISDSPISTPFEAQASIARMILL
jgi:hypothetical protein